MTSAEISEPKSTISRNLRELCGKGGEKLLTQEYSNLSKIKLIQSLVRNGLYYLSEPAYDEAEADEFDIYDIEQGILTARIRKSWPKEGKYELIGSALDRRTIGIVCRLSPARAKFALSPFMKINQKIRDL